MPISNSVQGHGLQGVGRRDLEGTVWDLRTGTAYTAVRVEVVADDLAARHMNEINVHVMIKLWQGVGRRGAAG